MFRIFLVLLILCINPSLYGDEKFHTFNISYSVNQTSSRVISIGLILVDINKYRELLPSAMIYNQILSHSKQKPFGDEHGRSTNAHETVHGINSELRNYFKDKLKKNVNAFYAGNGKGIVVQNPDITLRDVIPYIPSIVRGYRYNLYFVKQLGDWNEVPTYPIDEWSAYIAGAECAVDDTTQYKLPREKSDCVSGALEFSIYCTAVALAVKNHDQHYWNTNQQFKNCIQYFLIKSEKIFAEGQEIFPSKEQSQLLDHLRYHADTQDLREILLTEFQGIFVD